MDYTPIKAKPVVVVPYQGTWPSEFERIGKTLRSALGSKALRIDHIGSTSVPQLAAKDVIDIQVTVAHLPDQTILDLLSRRGFRPAGGIVYDAFVGFGEEETEELAKYYAGQAEGERRLHVHIREQGRFNQRYALLFRDYLRASPVTRQGYETIKFRLAEIFPESIDGYLYIKDPLMDIIFEAANHWAISTQWQPDEAYL